MRVSGGGGGGLPSGVIMAWSGTVADIPDGWTLCDGTDGAPDMTDRFPVGSGNNFVTESTGGVESVTVSESQIPSHRHASGTYSVGSHSHSYSYTTVSTSTTQTRDSNNILALGNVNDETESKTTGSSAPDISGLSSDEGGDGSMENRPSYHAAPYIMKT